MATVGNLFVNIRGSTRGLKSDLDGAKGMFRRAHKGLSRLRLGNLQTEAAEARKEYKKALEDARRAAMALGPSRRMGGEIAQAGREDRARAMSRLGAARDRMQQTSAVLSKAAAARNVAVTLSVLGLSVGVLRFLYSNQMKQFQTGRDKLEQFKFAGPFGGEIAKIEAAKIRARVAAAQDPTISRSFRERAMSELRLELTQTRMAAVANYRDVIFNSMQREFNYAVNGAYSPITQGIQQKADVALITGLTGQAP